MIVGFKTLNVKIIPEEKASSRPGVLFKIIGNWFTAGKELFWGDSREPFKIVDHMCLIEISAFMSELGKIQSWIL
jgi:hypothetical protein